MDIKIDTYYITTGMGKVIDNSDLPFLSSSEFDEFNKVGYTGRNNKGEKMSRSSFLNSLGHDTLYNIEQTNFDNGDFSEKFTITLVNDKLKKKKEKKHKNRNRIYKK